MLDPSSYCPGCNRTVCACSLYSADDLRETDARFDAAKLRLRALVRTGRRRMLTLCAIRPSMIVTAGERAAVHARNGYVSCSAPAYGDDFDPADDLPF